MRMRGSERQFPQVLALLKAELKARGLRQRDVAERLGVALATVKRWLAGDGLTVERLEELCALAGLDLFDLVATAAQRAHTLLDRFTPHQEQVLAQNPQLFFTFFSLLNGWPVDECRAELRIAQDHMQRLLQQLERLGLIDLRPDGRIRLLATRAITWRKNGPLAKYFAVTRTFVDFDPRRDHAVHMADFVRLSPVGVERVANLVAQLRRELHRIAEEDQKNTDSSFVWHGLLFLLRPLDMTNIRRTLASKAL